MRHVDDPPGHLGPGEDPSVEEETYAVRPYAVTGGRTASASTQIPVEALVQALAEPDVTMTPEKRRIVELTQHQYLSVAELSAHLRLPVPVVRIVLGDLTSSGSVRVHGTSRSDGYTPAATLSVLESVLNGISSL
ncbi:DUF742 domain-containing protein [Quadrisphaera sp. GCM10027208]|uniref:DUF742 domain-containing protein n=1 Tax=Quadrisphaera sp. GCM10027208 TaxID=3273423 RepID=UPI003608F7AF